MIDINRIYGLSIDLDRLKEFNPEIEFKQYDYQTSFIAFKFFKGEKQIKDIGDNYIIGIFVDEEGELFVNTDGTPIRTYAFNYEQEEGIIILPISREVINKVGTMACEILIINPDGKKVTSPRFTFTIQPSLYDYKMGEEVETICGTFKSAEKLCGQGYADKINISKYISYEKTVWVDGETVVNQKRLNNMEDGIYNATQRLNNAENEMYNVNQRLSNLDDGLNNLNDEVQNINKYIDNLDENLSNLNDEVQGVNQRLDNLDDDLSNLDDNLNNEIQDISQRLDNLDEKLNDEIQDVNQSLRNLNNEIQDVNQSLDNLDDKIQNTNKHIDNLDENLSNLDEKLNDEIQDVNQHLDNLDDGLNNLDNKIQNTNQRLDNLDDNLNNEIQDISQRLDNLDASHSNYETEKDTSIKTVKDALDKLVDSNGGVHEGDEPPIDTDLIWYDTSNRSIDKKLDSLIIEELKSIISSLSSEITSLKQKVEYLWNNQGNGGSIPSEPSLLLEDGSYLLLEDGSRILLEYSISSETAEILSKEKINYIKEK